MTASWSWLRLPDASLGLDHGLVRADQAGAWVDVESLARTLRQAQLDQLAQRERVLAETQAQADRLMSEARANADALLQAARVEAQALHQGERERGFAAGMEEAMTRWHAQRFQAALDRADTAEAQREVIAQTVAVAAERIVRATPAESMFERALAEVDDILRDYGRGVLRVHPQDAEAARAAVQAAPVLRDRHFRIDVIADAVLAPGACLFESELGTLDASLEVQLAALRAALVAVIDSEGDADDADSEYWESEEGAAPAVGFEMAAETDPHALIGAETSRQDIDRPYALDADDESAADALDRYADDLWSDPSDAGDDQEDAATGAQDEGEAPLSERRLP